MSGQREEGSGGVLIDGRELPTPLKTLRSVLGDARVEELQQMASELCFAEDFSVEELAVLAEFFRQCAEVKAWREGGSSRGVADSEAGR